VRRGRTTCETDSKKRIRPLIAPAAAITDNTATVSSDHRLPGLRLGDLAIVTGTDADADATFAALLEEGDVSNLSDAAAVADADMVSHDAGTAPEAAAGYTFADDAESRAVGYIGKKRYIRLTITPAANTGNHFVAGVAVLGLRSPGVNQLAASQS
jgi:hypothetical protein